MTGHGRKIILSPGEKQPKNQLKQFFKNANDRLQKCNFSCLKIKQNVLWGMPSAKFPINITCLL